MRSANGGVWKSATTGALGGLAGAWAMNLFQSLWSKASKELSQGNESGGGEDATVKTAKAISEKLFDHKLTEEEKKWAGPAVHYGFGTVAGATYGVLSATMPMVRSGLGTAYGSAVWLAADEIAVPAFGLSQSPAETPLSSHVQALIAHLVYGLTTELMCRAFVRM